MKTLLLTIALAASTACVGIADHHEKGEKLDAAKADVKITITGNDAMQYDKKEFSVTSGQVVALTFKNIGALPKEAMGHNVVILKPDTKIPDFAMAGMTNRPTFLPKEEKWLKAIIAKTKILGPKEEETIVFRAGDAGVYPYVCTFPGHFGVMQGKMTVKKK